MKTRNRRRNTLLLSLRNAHETIIIYHIFMHILQSLYAAHGRVNNSLIYYTWYQIDSLLLLRIARVFNDTYVSRCQLCGAHIYLCVIHTQTQNGKSNTRHLFVPSSSQERQKSHSAHAVFGRRFINRKVRTENVFTQRRNSNGNGKRHQWDEWVSECVRAIRVCIYVYLSVCVWVSMRVY